MSQLNHSRLNFLLKSEEQLFHQTHHKSYELYQRASRSLHGGVPMLFALNRGILMTPFHNMALISPEITQEDVDYHTNVFREAVATLFV